MITAVDTSVLLDIFLSDTIRCESSANKVLEQQIKGALVICEVVYSELACNFPSVSEQNRALNILGIELLHSTEETLWLSALLWKEALPKLKKREEILPDFLIAAHALKQADCLLTRDRGFYKQCFKQLKIIAP